MTRKETTNQEEVVLQDPGAVHAEEGDEQFPQQEKKHSVAKTFGIVAVLTVLSKVAGLIRDVYVAAAYGLSPIADAYNFAYLFTGNVLILFGGLGGPFHSSTVSIIQGKKDNRDSGVLITQIVAITVVVLTLITIAAYLGAPYLVSALKDIYAQMSNVSTKTEFEQATLVQLYWMLPLIVISGLVGVAYGVLNVYNRIVSPSLSPAIASIAIIICVWLSSQANGGQPTAMALALGTLIGAVGQLAIQFPSLAQLKLNWKLSTQPDPALNEYGKMLWPAVFSTSIGQLTVYVDAFFALQQQAAWSAIVNSNRLVQLPLGILLTAMLVPILPRFTQQVNEDRIDDLKVELRRSLRFLWFLALPLSAILLAIPLPIVQLLFMRGHFDERAAALVTSALIFLVPSIFFYVARDLMTRVFYAYKDSQTPYRVALLAIMVKAALDWGFVQVMERTAGISLATTVITIFNLSLLTWALKKKAGNLGFSQLLKPLSVMLLGTVVCGGVTYGAYYGFEQLHAAADTLFRLIYVGVASSLGLLLYVALCIGFQLDEPVAVAKRLPVLRKFVK